MNAKIKNSTPKKYPRKHAKHGSVFGILCASLVLNLNYTEEEYLSPRVLRLD